MNDLKSFLKKVNWKLLIAISLLTIIPTIYTTVRVYIIGQINDGSAYNIASQIQWLNILYEIITEALIVPIFFVIAKLKNEHKENILQNTISILFTIVFSIFLVFTICIFFSIKQILISLNVSNDIINKSVIFIRFETFSNLFITLSSFLIVAVSILGLKRYFIFLLSLNIVYLTCSITFDLFIMSNHNYSLNLGFVGAGISSLLSSLIYFIIVLIYAFVKKGIVIKLNIKYLQKDILLCYFKNFIIAGLETLIRNIIFTYMIIGMMAHVNKQDIYWQANSFIWSWLLLPINILSLFIKETNASTFYFSDQKKDIKYKLGFYYSMVAIIIIIWLGCLPLNPLFMKTILNYSNWFEVNKIVNLLFGFYLCFALSSVIDAYLISLGRIGLFLSQTIIVNFSVYPIYFLLYKLNIWIPDVNSIAIMFGIGLVVHLIVVSLIMYILLKYDDPFNKLANYFKNINNKKVYQKLINNPNVYKLLKYLKNENVKYIINYKEITVNSYKYNYVNKYSYSKCYELEKYQIISIIKMLKDFHNKSKTLYLNDNKINDNQTLYIHNDFSQFNLLFDIWGKPKYIIDFDDCKIGSKYFDIWHILSTAINLANYKNENVKNKLMLIKCSLITYGLTLEEYNLFLNDFFPFLYERRSFYLSKPNINIRDKIKWLNDLKDFYQDNFEELKNLF